MSDPSGLSEQEAWARADHLNRELGRLHVGDVKRSPEPELDPVPGRRDYFVAVERADGTWQVERRHERETDGDRFWGGLFRTVRNGLGELLRGP